MKTLISLGVILFATAAMAKSVEINNFYKINNSPLYEVCGQVVGGDYDHHDRALIVVDPRTNPGTHVVEPGPDGNFCLIINTLSGTIGYRYHYTGHKAPIKNPKPVLSFFKAQAEKK